MPWAHLTFERMKSVYAELIKIIHDGRHMSVEISAMETLIRAEYAKRDFTKRQLKIIAMIFGLSYPFGKEWAVIPKMRDFELCGISKIKIRKELEVLIEMGVVEWKPEEHMFKITDPRNWTGAPYHSGYNDDRSRELFLINLKHADIDIALAFDEIKGE
jgi:Bacteriophage replication protein O